jgi:hypothetical protein
MRRDDPAAYVRLVANILADNLKIAVTHEIKRIERVIVDRVIEHEPTPHACDMLEIAKPIQYVSEGRTHIRDAIGVPGPDTPGDVGATPGGYCDRGPGGRAPIGDRARKLHDRPRMRVGISSVRVLPPPSLGDP